MSFLTPRGPGDSHGGTSAPTSRVARMLALAYAIERLMDAGDIKDYATAAAALGSTRARMSQVLDLVNLSPQLQEAILKGEVVVSERRLRSIVREVNWRRQETLVGF